MRRTDPELALDVESSFRDGSSHRGLLNGRLLPLHSPGMCKLYSLTKDQQVSARRSEP